MDNEYLQEQKKKREKLFGYIFLAWFICSFIGFFIIDDDNYMIMNLGQYFLVFGLMVIFKAKKYEKLIAVPLAMIGLSCIIIPYFMMHPELVPSGVDLDDVIVLLILCGFLITGLCAAAVPILKRKHLKEICTYEVQATVIDYAVSTSRKGTTIYAPIYGFWFNGKDWRVCSNTYSNIGIPERGKTYTLKINPENPAEFFNEKNRAYLIEVFVGILVFIFISSIMYLLLTKGLTG